MKRLSVLLALFTVACAGVSVHETDVGRSSVAAANDERMSDANATGIRYYLPAPYILVYSTSPGRFSSEVVYMPDLDRVMSIDPYSILASNNTKLTFKNGMLVSGNVDADATVIPAAVLDALKGVALAAVEGGNAPDDGSRRLPPPYLFRVVVDEDGTRLVGGPAAADAQGNPPDIRVIVAPPLPADAKQTPPNGAK